MPIIGVIASSMKGAPGIPTIGTVTDVGTGRAYNNGAATVPFTAAVGGAAATSFTVKAYTTGGSYTGLSATGASSPLTVTGLSSSTQYKYTVFATNASGSSAESSFSNTVTATTVPQAPTIGTATATGTTTATVAFTAGATGGSAITSFTATSSPSSITGTGVSSPITVSGLASGVSYTFTVTATNANGTSTASAASNSITTLVPGDFYQIATATPNGATSYTFSGIPTTYRYLELRVFGNFTNGNRFTSIRFNNNTGTVYTGSAWWADADSGSSVNRVDAQGGTSAPFYWSRTGLVTGSGVFTIGKPGGSDYKPLVGFFGGSTNSAFEGWAGMTGFQYRTTGALTDITVTVPNSDTFANTRFSIYGVA